jgi:hypothetical protein
LLLLLLVMMLLLRTTHSLSAIAIRSSNALATAT